MYGADVMWRRPRLFISHASVDAPLLASLIDWLRARGVEPVTGLVPPGPRLEFGLMAQIEASDGLLALGTAAFMSAGYFCENEVRIAAAGKKEYFPVLLDGVPDAAIPEWFKRPDRASEHVFIRVQAGAWQPLAVVLPRLKKFRVLRLGLAVLIAFLFLALGPVVAEFFAWDQANARVVAAQTMVETLNQELKEDLAAVPAPGWKLSTNQSVDVDGAATTIRCAVKGDVSVCDSFAGSELRQREYRRGDRRLAIDRFEKKSAGNKGFSLTKVRTITPEGDGGPTIEDRYDSVGNLISKRVYQPKAPSARSYADVGRSVFPIFLVPAFSGPYP
jgi:hypothetical protein